MRILVAAALAMFLPALGALGPLESRAQAAPAQPGWTYRVTVDDALQRMDVRICFHRFLPRRLILGPGASLVPFDFTVREPGAARLVPQSDRASVAPRSLAPGGCVTYRVDLGQLVTRGGGHRKAFRVGRDLVVAPGLLFFKPALWPQDAEVAIEFHLPEGLRPAVPWPPITQGRNAYRLDPFALTLRGLVAFGRFPVNQLEVAGTRMDIAVLDAPHRATRDGLRAWLSAAASAVADLYGRFPAPRVTVLVQPVPARRPAVVFGRAMRAGGAHAHLLLSAAAPDEDLPGEWVGVHELMHLGMPWTHEGEAWLQEGFVTYYQEVLRARAGFLSEQEAWQQLHEGFGRGRGSGGQRALARESREMARHHTYWRVYWAGAALALLLDLELRKRWPGQRSLDDAMRMLHTRFGGTRRAQSGVELMRAVDRWLGRPLCAPEAERCLASASFPDLRAAYTALGLRVVDGRIVVEPDAPRAEDRARIMHPGGR